MSRVKVLSTLFIYLEHGVNASSTGSFQSPFSIFVTLISTIGNPGSQCSPTFPYLFFFLPSSVTCILIWLPCPSWGPFSSWLLLSMFYIVVGVVVGGWWCVLPLKIECSISTRNPLVSWSVTFEVQNLASLCVLCTSLRFDIDGSVKHHVEENTSCLCCNTHIDLWKEELFLGVYFFFFFLSFF